MPCIASRYVVQEKGAKYKPRTEEKARIGVERPFAKLSGGTREIGRNPRVTASRKCRMQLALCRALAGRYTCVLLGQNLHPPLLIGNHCHAANCQPPARRIGSDPNTTDSRFRPARSRYPDYPRSRPLKYQTVRRGEVSDFGADFSSQLGTDSSSRIFQVRTGKKNLISIARKNKCTRFRACYNFKTTIEY